MRNAIILVGINKNYKIYIPYYIMCLYYTNPELDIIIVTDDSHIPNYNEAMDYVSKLYGINKIKIYTNPLYLKNIRDNVTKYFNQKNINITVGTCSRSLIPIKYYEEYDYVYIGDIDLFITEKDFFKKHIEHANKCNISFSNFNRTGYGKYTYRLSGLHFICCKKYIELYRDKINNFSYEKYRVYTKKNNIKNSMLDEYLWYYIVDDDEINKLNKYPVYRNFHGIHLGIYRSIIHKIDNINVYEYTKKYNCPKEDTIDDYINDIRIIIRKYEFKKVHELLKDFRVTILYRL